MNIRSQGQKIQQHVYGDKAKKTAESTITKLGTVTVSRPSMNIRSKVKVTGLQST